MCAALLILALLPVAVHAATPEFERWQQQIRAARDLAKAAEYGKAEAALRDVLSGIKRERNPATRALAAATWNELATVYHELGKELEAERGYRTSIRLWEKDGGPEAAGLAQPLLNLGQLLAVRHRFGEAEKAFRRSLRIREKHRGAADPSLAAVRCLRMAAGDLTAAEGFLLRAYCILETEPGIRADRAAIRYNLGDLYRLSKRPREAEIHSAASVEDYRALYGDGHPNYAKALSGLARVYANRGDTEDAEALFRQSVSILETALGPEYPGLAPVLRHYSEVLRAAGQEREAKALRERAGAVAEAAAKSSLRHHSVDISELGGAR